MRHLATLIPLALLLSACSSEPDTTTTLAQGQAVQGGFLLDAGHANPLILNGDYANNANAQRFVDKMVNEHGFDRQQLHSVLAQTKRLDWVIRLMDRQAPSPTGKPPSGPNGAWLRYRNKFITPDNLPNGVAFWNQYADTLERAHQTYGVPPEIIVGIIGVETRWGRVMGKTRIIDALATLSFDYPRRSAYFTGELETFLLMSRKEGRDPLDLRGSYAGAMGYGQFMPSSFKEYAVDFNGDGHINLWDPEDAIGSVANYFRAHGWQRDAPVAIRANGQAPLMAHGFKTRYTVGALQAAGLTPQGALGRDQKVSLLRLDAGKEYQYWFGLPNFYTITRYNHSTYYAMAVWQLGEAVARARRGG